MVISNEINHVHVSTFSWIKALLDAYRLFFVLCMNIQQYNLLHGNFIRFLYNAAFLKYQHQILWLIRGLLYKMYHRKFPIFT